MLDHIDILCYPTLAELLQLPVFKGSQILCGEENLHRRVTGINATDVPDYYNWIAAGELMVTACYALREDPAAQEQFIPQLADRNLAGVCVKSSRFFGTLPESILHAAKERQFPLIDLAPDVRFADINRAVSDELTRRRTEILRSCLSVNQLFTQMITEGSSLEEIAKTVSDISNSSVLITDDINNRRAYALSQINATQLSALSACEIPQQLMSGGTCHKIQIENHAVGALYLYGNTSSLNPEILSQVLHMIPLEISRVHSIRENESRNFTDFILHLLSDQITDEVLEQERAKSFGLDLAQAHVIIRIRIDRPQEIGHYSFAFRKTLFLQTLCLRLEHLGVLCHTMQETSDILLLLSPPRNAYDLSAALEWLPGIFEDLLSQHPDVTVAIGCSRVHAGLAGLLLCDREAQLAMQAAVAHSGFLLFDNLGILRLLYSGDPYQEIQAFISETLKDLCSTESDHNAELLKTLNCYFRNLGNQRAMAKDLFIHYNTVAYRLKSIQDMTQMDLEKPEDRLQLELALYLYKFHSRSRTYLPMRYANMMNQ